MEHAPTYLELLIFSPALFVYSQGVSALEKKIIIKKINLHDCYYTEGADRDEMEEGINPLKG